MSAVRFILGFIGFLALYALADWLGGVTAPVLGPALMVGLIVFLIALIARLAKAGK